MWVGTYGMGINRISTQPYTIFSPDADKYGENVNSIVTDNKYKWIGTEKGLIKTELNSNTILGFYPSEKYLEGAIITSLYIQKNNKIWIGTSGKGVYTFNISDNSFDHFFLSEGMLENIITSVTGYNEQLWIGTKKGACHIDLVNNRQKWYTISNGGLPHNSIKQIYTDSTDNIWIVTLSNTICHIANNQINKYVIPFRRK